MVIIRSYILFALHETGGVDTMRQIPNLEKFISTMGLCRCKSINEINYKIIKNY